MLQGEKVLVLKKKYRPPGPGDSFRGSTASVSSTSSSLSASSTSQNSLYKSSAIDSGMVTPQKSVRDERAGASEERTPVPSPQGAEESPRAKSEPPASEFCSTLVQSNYLDLNVIYNIGQCKKKTKHLHLYIQGHP